MQTRIPITIDGVEYPSIRACAKALGVSYSMVTHRRRKGMPPEEALMTPSATGKIDNRGTPVTIDGTDYPSIYAAMKATGWSRKRVEAMLRPKDASQNARRVTAFGVTYPTAADFADANGLPRTTVCRKLKQGVDPETILLNGDTRRRSLKSITAFGVVYPTAADFIAAHDLPMTTVYRKLKQGIDPETILRNAMTRSMTTLAGKQIYVPFDHAPVFAFTSEAGENWYYAKCPICGAVLLVREEDLPSFRHDDELCDRTALPAYAKTNNQRVGYWMSQYRGQGRRDEPETERKELNEHD